MLEDWDDDLNGFTVDDGDNEGTVIGDGWAKLAQRNTRKRKNHNSNRNIFIYF